MKGIVDYLLADENFKIVLSMIISIIVLIFNKVIVRAILAVIMKFFFKLSKEFKNKISSALENPFRLIIVTLSTFILLMAINAEHNFIKNIILIKLYSSINLLIILKLVYTLSDINSVLIERFEEKFNYSFDKGVMSLLSKTMKIIILIIGGAAVIKIWGYNINPIVTMVGIFSAVIGLAAKDYLTNVIGGIVIVSERPFSIGDYIQTQNCEGIVEDISFRTTKVRTFDKALLSIPNSTLSNDVISNYSRRDMRRAKFSIGITYDTPIDTIKVVVDKIREMLIANEDVDNDGLICHFDEFADSSLNISLSFYINKGDLGEYLKAKEAINLDIMRILKSENVEMAFPSRTVYVQNINK